MHYKSLKIGGIIMVTGLLLTGTAQAFDFGKMMNPSKWMGGNKDKDRSREPYGGDDYGYPGGPGYGGAPGGFGGPPGYGGAPGGYGGVPGGYGGAPGGYGGAPGGYGGAPGGYGGAPGGYGGAPGGYGGAPGGYGGAPGGYGGAPGGYGGAPGGYGDAPGYNQAPARYVPPAYSAPGAGANEAEIQRLKARIRELEVQRR